MNNFKCKNCGASDFEHDGGQLVCTYCGSVFETAEDANALQTDTTISLSDDVQTLLLKMQTNPQNARLYANLILDIDPTNMEIQKYL